MVAVYAAYLWRLEHIGHNWNLIMAEPVPPFYLFLAKLLVVTKLVLLTQAFVFVLYWFCGRDLYILVAQQQLDRKQNQRTSRPAKFQGFAWYVWPYCLMQRGMNANQSSDMLADSYLGFALACVGWLALILLAVQLLLSHQDVKVR